MALPPHLDNLLDHAIRLRRAAAPASRNLPFCAAWFSDERQTGFLDLLRDTPPVPPGTMAIIFRHYTEADRAGLCREVAALATARNMLMLVAGDAALAETVGTAGVHLPGHLAGEAASLNMANTDWLVSIACHTPAEVTAAERAGADLAFLSPIFPTRSHRSAAALGVPVLTDVVRSQTVPVFALGGVTPATLPLLHGTGTAGFGAIDAFAVTDNTTSPGLKD